MKAVLISIQPKWCELIASGKKTVDVRKTKPKIDTPFKVYIYCTQGKDVLAISRYDDKSAFLWDKSDVDRYNADMVRNGKVIGEFICKEVSTTATKYGVYLINEQTTVGLTAREVCEYGNGKQVYFWHISDLVIYDNPRELSEFYKKCERFACDGCEHLKYQRVNADEYDYECEFFNYHIPITRPPQSWCYVEGGEG